MLSIETKETETKKNETPTLESYLANDVKYALESYLSGGVKFIGNVGKNQAAQRAAEYIDKVDTSIFMNNPKKAKEAIAETEASLKKEAKQFGLQEKMNYAFNTRAIDANPMEALAQHLFIAAGTAAAMTTAMTANAPEAALALGVAGAALQVTLASGRFLSSAENASEKKSVAEYAEIKHAQLALKQLKKAVLAPEIAAQKAKDKELVNRAFASGMGNPGGMIAALKGKDGR